MTLAPLENRSVRAVASERYPLNKQCAEPGCDQKATEPHHCFRRSQIGGDSWFVEISSIIDIHQTEWSDHRIIPHVTGLCHAHHSDITEHRAWIKYEDGIWNWYERDKDDESGEEWFNLLGSLNPQPGSVEGKPKRKRFKGEAKRARRTISIRIPEGSDYQAYEEKMEQASEIISRELGLESPYPFIVLDAALQSLIEQYGL